MTSIKTRTLETAPHIRDAVFEDDTRLLVTDGAADIWSVDCHSGRAVLAHEGAHILETADRSLPSRHAPIRSPCAGTYPLISVAGNGGIVVATHDMVLVAKVPGREWILLSSIFGLYYPELQFSDDGKYLVAISEGAYMYELDEGRTIYRETDAVEAKWASLRNALLVQLLGGQAGWVELDCDGKAGFKSVEQTLPGNAGVTEDSRLVFVFPDGARALMTRNNLLVWLDLASFVVVRELAFSGAVQSCVVARNGSIGVVKLEDGAAFVVDLANGMVIGDMQLGGARADGVDIKISPSGRTILTLGPLPANPYPPSGKGVGWLRRDSRLHVMVD